MCGIELYLNNAFWYMLGSIISIIIFKLGSVSEVYKIQVNDSEPIEVSKQVYEVSFCFNEMLKEKDKEIERLNNIINKGIEAINIYQNEKTLSVGYQDLKRIRGILQGNEFDLQMFEKYLQELKGSNKE